jgi:hypothetical protein
VPANVTVATDEWMEAGSRDVSTAVNSRVITPDTAVLRTVGEKEATTGVMARVYVNSSAVSVLLYDSAKAPRDPVGLGGDVRQTNAVDVDADTSTTHGADPMKTGTWAV